MTGAELLAILDEIAPPELAEPWDKIGLQVGDPHVQFRRVLVTLDFTIPAMEQAREIGADVIVAHHPLIWNPLTGITPDAPRGDLLMAAIRQGLTFIACHTNWDAATGGINDALAARIGLVDVQVFGGFGRIGTVPPTKMKDCADLIGERLGSRIEAWGDPERLVERIAVVGGAAGSMWKEAILAGAHLFVTGEVKQNEAVEATDQGLDIFAAGHFATEHPGMEVLAHLLKERGIDAHIFTPEPGFGGRPL